jgi:fatty-acyl-CoA synthase
MIRVGNAQAFWGDRPSAAAELLSQSPELDFLTMDYLAEVSMSILAVQRERDPRSGFPQDFVEVVRGLASYWDRGGRCKLIANAGGLNPLGCATACASALASAGCRSLKIAVVSGDDVLPLLLDPTASDDIFRNLDSGQPLAEVRQRLVTANAYMGCAGIVQALEAGADIVITGRVADPSMVVAACVYSFGWALEDWDRLAGATVAGHLLECGTQVTGGISTDWLEILDPAHIAFPIAEIHSDGHCTITIAQATDTAANKARITKSEGAQRSGGRVTVETVKEQLVYEIGDPHRYLSPDVTVSFLDLEVIEHGENRVTVVGAKGRPRPATLKVSATYRDGYRAAGMLTIFGPQAIPKARRCGQIVLQRLEDSGCVFRDAIIECLGSGDSVPVESVSAAKSEDQSFESVLRIAVESDDRSSVERFTRELMPLVTAGPPGTTGYAEGRPRVHPLFRYWPCLVEAERVTPHVAYLTSPAPTAPSSPAVQRVPATAHAPAIHRSAASEVLPGRQSHGRRHRTEAAPVAAAPRLADLAYGRSGDKGTSANIGILARAPAEYARLREWLTAERVQRFFEPIGVDSVQRYEIPNLHGFNFLLRGILRRGLRNDAQGKALAQALLTMPLDDTSPAAPWVDGRTIGDVLRETARKYPHRTAAVFSSQDVRWSWRELDALVDRAACGLLALGFRRGDHFGVWATNVPEWVVLQFATARIGVVLVTINPSYRTPELAYVLEQAQLRGLALIDQFKTTDYFAALHQAVPELATRPAGELGSTKFPHLQWIITLRGAEQPGTITWAQLLARGEPISAQQLHEAEQGLSCSDPINIQYTSGTTGFPKGAMLSHRNVLLNAYYAGLNQQLSSQDSICIPVPLYHCFGCVLGTLCSIVYGAAMVFPAETFQAAATLQAIERERSTAVYGVPTMFITMLEHPDFPQRRLKSLRTGIMAGSPCPIELMKRVARDMGAAQMTIGYGQTEASPLMTQTRVDDSLELRVASVGTALPGVEVKIVDPETGRDLDDSHSGELCCRGHNVMLGYFNLPEKTAEAIDAEGWLHSGDLGKREPNGYFHVTGRLRDLIIRGGENVYPREIEEVLYQHPDVEEVQVIGVPDRKFGEEVMAWVRLRSGRTATAEQLKTFCQGKLAHFKVPHYWKFVDAFPSTVTGKIQKYRMREISIEELGLQDVARIQTA